MKCTAKENMITVFLNNKPCQLTKEANLFAALEQNGIHTQKGIAVALNNVVIPKAEWQNKSLQPNDKITIIKASQGG